MPVRVVPLELNKLTISSPWTENMHSLSLDPLWKDATGLALYLTSGLTFEKHKFGGWGANKSFPEVKVKRGQSGHFCDSWNGECTAIIDTKTHLSPERKCNGPIKSLSVNLTSDTIELPFRELSPLLTYPLLRLLKIGSH